MVVEQKARYSNSAVDYSSPLCTPSPVLSLPSLTLPAASRDYRECETDSVMLDSSLGSQHSFIQWPCPSPVLGAGVSSSKSRRDAEAEAHGWPKAMPRYTMQEDLLAKLDTGQDPKTFKHVQLINDAWYLDASKRTVPSS